MPDNITDWYGNNTIGWGEAYKSSFWGNVNETNSWGIIYPDTAEGTVIRASSDNIEADTTSIFADNSPVGSVISFTCSNSDVNVKDGTTGNTISITNDIILSEGTVISVSPSTYQNGSTAYTVNIEVPDNGGYDNGGDVVACTDTATGTGALVSFACSNTGLSVSNGTIGATISIGTDATVTAGNLTSVSPSTYQTGTVTYTGAITAPSGFSNSGSSISCTDTATGTSASLPSSPIGTAISTDWFALGSMYTGSQFLYPKTAAPLSSGLAPTIASITDFNGNSYSDISNNRFKLDTANPIVGTFIADFQGTFFDSSNNHNTSFYDAYSYFNTAKYFSIKSSARAGGSTISETTIYKLEQNNGYIQITQIITI